MLLHLLFEFLSISLAEMSLPSWRIDKDVLSILLLLLPYPLMIYNPCTASPLYSFCPSPTQYPPNSTFESNLKLLLSYLPSNTSLTGFYNTSVGDDPDQVYGLTLCRGDVTPEVCKDCIETASREILTLCPYKEDAIIWYEFCQLRYKYQRFFGTMVYAGKYPPWNYQQQNISKNPDQFSAILNNLLIDVANRGAYNSSMFATGEDEVPRTWKVHALGQCTRDISSGDCETCLKNAIGDLEGCCSSLQGGKVLDTSCNLMFEVSIVKGKGKKISVVVIVIIVSIFVLAILGAFYAYYRWGRKGRQKEEGKNQNPLLHNLGAPISTVFLDRNTQEENQMDSLELPLIDFETITVATDNFLDSNKLGQGGFGTVYKGTLPDGKEIAVKRLSRKSWQGLEEFKNEVILIAKLQHRNLVRLLGCGIEGEEKLLIYEFMPNTSLDVFIFNPTMRSQLDWNTRYNIIGGIARGLLYLHEDSRLKIIHRDLKPSNVLLDHDMVAKISDFGMARIFCDGQNTANTKRVVGTYGYMSPEYAMEGLFSVKSDVFSFGVILLEILSGQRNSSFYHTEHAQTLLAYAWRRFVEGKGMDFVDPLLIDKCSIEDVLKCIHIGLLCVQEDAADRPTMSSIVVMLESDSTSLPQPTQPAFALGRVVVQRDQSSTVICSVNAVTVSSVSPR